MTAYIVIAIAVTVAIIFAFWLGGRVALNKKAKKMIEEMNFGTIIFDMTSVEADTISCEFDKNPKEMLGFNYILMEVKIRR